MPLFLPPPLIHSDSSRSPEWMAVRDSLDKLREKTRGKGFVFQLERTGPEAVAIRYEFRGDEACRLSYLVGDPTAKEAKPKTIYEQPDSFFGMLRNPIPDVLHVPAGTTEVTFVLAAQGLGAKLWKIPLPEAGAQSKVLAIYLPDPSRTTK